MPSTACPDARRDPLAVAPPPDGATPVERALVFLAAPVIVLGYFVIITVLRCAVHHRH